MKERYFIHFLKLLSYFLSIRLLVGCGKLFIVLLKTIIMIIVAFYLEHTVPFMVLL